MNWPLSIHTAWPAVLVAALPVLFWMATRGRARLGRRHLMVTTALRAAAILCLALALMRPQWHGSSAGVSVVYALDVSRSVSSAFIDSAIDWMARADREGHPARARYLAFANGVVAAENPPAIRKLVVTDASRGAGASPPNALDQSATNLEQALDGALLELDHSRAKRIVLLTDGNQTDGDVWRALPRLLAAGVRVFPVPAKVRADNDAWVAGMDLPPDVRAGEPISVVVRVIATMEATAQVSLRNTKALLGTRRLQLRAGENRVAFEIRLPHIGATTLAAEVVAAGDTIPENNRMQETAWVGARPRVLYVEDGQADSVRYLADALNGQGLDTHVIVPTELPVSAAGLASYDAVILSDVPAKMISAEAMQAIASYVRDAGGGLLFTSGDNVHGEKGYSDTALEQALPIEFRAQEKRKDLAMVVALDRSYSMKGRKMEMAKEATRAALDLLEEQHRFAVVAFDSQTYIAVPMQTVHSRRKAQDQISRIQASGQTNIYPALGIVYRMLQKVDSKAKHVILLSDGDTSPADFETLVKRMSAEKIVVSTVAVGADADVALMSDIAKWGKGRAYVAEDANSIPQIFIEETERAVHSNLLEESFKPVVKRGGAALRGIDAGALPELRGLVSSKARDHAEILLAAPSGSPLLARWQYGLGTAVAFTSDVKNRWASDWIKWPGYAKFWAQQVRDVMRRDPGEALDFHVVREAGAAVIRLSALTAQGGFRDGLAPKVRITRPDGTTSTVVLAQTGAGQFEARWPLDRALAAERFELVEAAGITPQSLSRTGSRVLHQDYAEEYRGLPPDMKLLEGLASATGGKVAPSIAEIFAQRGDASADTRDLWPWIAACALLFYLLDIALRRSPLAWRWLEPQSR
jgi:uncharacterized membrane protein/uncharacterized protein YegL